MDVLSPAEALGKVCRGVVRDNTVGQGAYEVFPSPVGRKPVQTKQVWGHMRQEGETANYKAHAGF